MAPKPTFGAMVWSMDFVNVKVAPNIPVLTAPVFDIISFVFGGVVSTENANELCRS